MSEDNPESQKKNYNIFKKELSSIIKKEEEPLLPKRAYSILRYAIRNLLLDPGQNVLEREMAEMLDMSRIPLKEALVRLQTEGLIHIVPRRGFTVKTIEAKELEEIYEIAENLDGLATELATKKVQETEIHYLENIIKKQKIALQCNKLEEWSKLDDQFHSHIIDLANNYHLKKNINMYTDHLYRARLYTINYRPTPYHSITEHQAILKCMEAQNYESAKLMMQSHRKRAKKVILKALNERNLMNE